MIRACEFLQLYTNFIYNPRMIVEIFENSAEFEGRVLWETGNRIPFFELSKDEHRLIDMEYLEPIFHKMRLPLPDKIWDTKHTHENGYLLPINRYNAALRLYPTPDTFSRKERKAVKRNGEDINSHSTHIYHPNTLNPVGYVQFDGFILQLMAGGLPQDPGQEERERVFREIIDAVGNLDIEDAHKYNFGLFDGKIKLLDTPGIVDVEVYKTFYEQGLLESLVEESQFLEDLQELFYDAWTGQNGTTFNDLWIEMEKAGEDGIIVDGWNFVHEIMNEEDSELDESLVGLVMSAARSYDKKLTEYLKQENHLQADLG